MEIKAPRASLSLRDNQGVP